MDADGASFMGFIQGADGAESGKSDAQRRFVASSVRSVPAAVTGC